MQLDSTRFLRNRQLENSLCHVHRDDGMLFHRLRLFLDQGRLWHMMPTASQGGVHSIIAADEAR